MNQKNYFYSKTETVKITIKFGIYDFNRIHVVGGGGGLGGEGGGRISSYPGGVDSTVGKIEYEKLNNLKKKDITQ